MVKFFFCLYLLIWPILGEFTLWDMGAGFPALDFYRPLPIIFALLTLIRRLGRGKSIKTDAVIWFALLFVLYFIFNIGINGVGSTLVHAFREVLRRYLIPIAVYFTLINLASEINKRTLVRIFLFSGIYIAGVGIIEFVAGRNLIGPVGFVGSGTLYRTNGPFWDGIGYAGVVLSFLPFSYYCLKEKLIGIPFSAFCAVMFSAGCLVNYSRAIWLTFIIITIILLLGKDTKTILISFYGIAGLAVAGYFIFRSLQGSELFESRITDPRNIIQRYEQYKDALSLFLQHPVFGKGFLMYMKTHPVQLHNSYLLILVEFGLIGGFFYALHLISVLFIRFRLAIETNRAHVLKMRLSLILLVLIVPNTIDFLGNAYFILMIFVMTAIVQIEFPESDRRNSLDNS